MKKIVFTLTLISTLLSYSQNQEQNQLKIDSITALDEVIIKPNTILGNKFVAKIGLELHIFYQPLS